jgi:hypothetical protein
MRLAFWRRSSLALMLSFSPTALAATPADPPTWEAVDKILGQTGKVLPGEVHKYSWPRTDLKVTLDGVQVEPGLALGSWAGFIKAGSDGHVMSMGDLMLLTSEVDPVIRAMQEGGIEVVALHNHLLGESPTVMAVHFSGHGEPEKIALTLKSALEKTATPTPHPATARPSAAEAAAFERVQAALGYKGTVNGHVLQVGVARAGKIEDGGIEVPPSMGMNNPMNFQLVGERVATTGDFLLVADEVNPVIRELEAHRIRVTALHSHMLRDTPRLFFMHFWGLDDPTQIAGGLKAALSKVAVQ